MDKLNFWEIFKKAFELSWQNKKLWWFGLIVGSGSGLNFNFPFSSQKKIDDQASLEQFYAFLNDHLALIAGAVFALLTLVILFKLFQILAYGGLVRKLMSLEKEKDLGFWKGIKEGKIFFWRIFEIRLIFTLTTLALILILALPAIFLFSLHSYVLGAITILLALLIFFPALIIFFFLEKFGALYVITSNLTLRAALEQGYRIFWKNIWPSIVMALLFIPLNILAGVVMLISIFVIGLPFLVLGIILFQVAFPLGVWVIGITGGLILAVFIIFLRSFLGVFYSATWFLFFKEIATAKKEEAKIKEEVIITEGVQPEKV